MTGSRDLTDRQAVSDALDELYDRAWHYDGSSLTIVHGGARGADTLASEWCQMHNDVIEEVHKPDWDAYGKVAGFVRNQEMVSLGADVCLAFPRGKSAGTRDCIARAENYMIPVVYG